MKKFFSLLLALTLCLSLASVAFAATAPNATIDTGRTASLSLYKYDFTSANKDGILEWDTYISTGLPDKAVEEALASYALQGVVFTYLKVADITTYSAQEADGYKDMVLYAMTESGATTQLLTALGLSPADAYRSESKTLYFTSDKLVDALNAKQQENSSNLKNALERLVADHGGTNLPETDQNGHTSANGLDLGLYLIVETYVPENVFTTTNPFFLSLPSTTIDGKEWNYDLTVYPKNETDQPTLEKTLRESKPDTGKHNGKTDDITDGYAHTGTGSDGDVVDYQIISTLPKITSNATALTAYTFNDTLSKGIDYNKKDVKLEWFKDAACTQKVAAWDEASGKFTVAYGTAGNGATTMEIAMTPAGLDEINNADTVYDAARLFRGYSSCTLRITYTGTVNSSAEVVCGDNGNPNTVKLTWKRTNTSYYDTLQDDCHFYSYGMDLTKKFNDDEGNFANVQFVIHNDTDNYWVKAQLNEAEGIYYVTGHVAEEAQGTKFIPVSAGDQPGKVIIKGLEDDTYTITEVATDAGYTLLEEAVKVVITSKGNGVVCPVCGKEGITATAAVNGDPVTMTEDNGSVSAIVPLTVVNTKGFDLPRSGDHGTWLFAVGGAILFCAGIACLAVVMLKQKKAAKH